MLSVLAAHRQLANARGQLLAHGAEVRGESRGRGALPGRPVRERARGAEERWRGQLRKSRPQDLQEALHDEAKNSEILKFVMLDEDNFA